MKKNYFEGWYFKNTNETATIAFIPSYHIDDKGKIVSSLQVITNDFSHSFSFNENEFFVDKKNLIIKIGKNVFSKNCIAIDIERDEFKILGKLDYTNITPIKYDIMGPFAYVPGLECRHSVISMRHTVNGSLNINGENYIFNNSIGYIENDRGRSFPNKYLWTQFNMNNIEKTSLMLSIATVKAFFSLFNGTICVIQNKGKEYRLATYLGAKIVEFRLNYAKIKQGKMVLIAEQLSEKPHNLNAPVNGLMKRIIRESPSCSVRYKFIIDNKIVFDFVNNQASFEYSYSNTTSLDSDKLTF